MQELPAVLDHLVLPTADLGAARGRLTKLGFTVSPEGVHPFGTRNCCVYFQDDTFLEPLAVVDAATADAAIEGGNVFVARDRLFRGIAGDEGFSALVLASRDADRDHARFVADGISAGGRLDFSRFYRDAGGADREVSFRLAFAARADAAASFFFTCERVDAPAGGRGALAVHRNGVTGIARVIATSGDPARDAAFLARFAGAATAKAGAGFELALASAAVEVMDDAGFAHRFGYRAPDGDGKLRLAAIRFACGGALEAELAGNGVEYRRRDGLLVVPPAPGQGAAFIFEDRQ